MESLTITAAMERRNGYVFLVSFMLIYLAAPVTYIGVVQAALCDKLGANATVANLPTATYLLGGLAPLFLSMLVPHRLDGPIVVWSNGLTALVVGLVTLALLLPVPAWISITALVVQGLFQGFSGTTAQVFTFQCLGRGSTLEGRARILKRTFTVGPLLAVIGSLAAQQILNSGIRSVVFPYDFALLYFIGFLCQIAVTMLSAFYCLAPIGEDPRPPFLRNLVASVRNYVSYAPLLLLFFTYTLWYCSLSASSNFSLYTKEAMGRDPKDFAALIMGIRFGAKSLAGYVVGMIAMRFGLRSSVITTTFLLAAGVLWAWLAPGYWYLLAFGFMGAGELGGAYIPNYGVALSAPEAGARNLSLLSLASPASSFAPAVHGALTERFGFRGSFIFGLVTAVMALLLATRIHDDQH